MKSSGYFGRLKYFFFGVVTVLGVLFLTGAIDATNPTLNYGRYQISAWGTGLEKDSGAFGVFVVDTVSGETKMVYTRVYGSPDKGKVVVDNLGKSFSSM